MKNGKSLQELAAELERRAGAKQDVVADTRKLELVIPETDKTPVLNVEGVGEHLGINQIAHDQIASRLEIPAKYYNRLRADHPELLVDNVNTLLHAEPENRLVRMLDGRVRAFLSDRYQRIENEQIASAVLPILLSEPDVRVESCEITESRMYIKAVFPRIQAEVRKGDIVQSGIAISNSEVGQGSVKIEPLVFRLVCLNGLIINDAKYSARHVGGRIGSGDENIAEILSDEALRADDHAILLKTRDVVKASFDIARFNRHVEAMQQATQDFIEGNPAEAVKLLTKQHGLSQFEEGGILRQLIQGADLSRYGLLNAVTRTAQDVESYDRSTELEALGGKILNLNPKEWQVISQAA